MCGFDMGHTFLKTHGVIYDKIQLSIMYKPNIECHKMLEIFWITIGFVETLRLYDNVFSYRIMCSMEWFNKFIEYGFDFHMKYWIKNLSFIWQIFIANEYFVLIMNNAHEKRVNVWSYIVYVGKKVYSIGNCGKYL